MEGRTGAISATKRVRRGAVFEGKRMPRGTRAAYLQNEDSKALFEILMLFERLCIDEKIVEPRGGQFVMRPTPLNEPPVTNATH